MISLPSPEHFFDTWYVMPHLKLLPTNALTFDQLYTHYLEAGFIYPAKLERLSDHLDLIRENWTRGYAGALELLWTIAYHDERFDKMGSVTCFRTTNHGWQSQHLTSQNNAAGLFSLLLAAHGEGVFINCAAMQNWYSPTNAFAMKIYDRIPRVLGPRDSTSQLLNYFLVNPLRFSPLSRQFKVVRCRDNERSLVRMMARRLRGDVYCRAEELDSDDIELDFLDRVYRRYGLRRRRFIWVAADRVSGEPLGMIVAHRGPLGLSFSFLENRCDLLVDPDLAFEQKKEISSLLIARAAQAYFDSRALPAYPLADLVVIAPEDIQQVLLDIGGVKTRQYYQGIWLNAGFEKWKKYMTRVFSPVIQRFERQIRAKEPAGI